MTASVERRSTGTPRRTSHGPLARRVYATEVRRTGAPLLALVLALVGAALLLTNGPPFTNQAPWSSSLLFVSSWLDNANAFWGPLAATVGAWVGGRDRRRRIGELLHATARPAWQRRTATWAAVLAGVLAGWLLQAVVLIAAVLPAVSYGGGRWLPTLALTGLALGLFATAGFAAGRLLPGRLTAPLVGAAGYALTALVAPPGGLRRLLPVSSSYPQDGHQLRAAVLAGSAVWLLALTATVLLLAVAQRRALAVLPFALALLVVVPLGAAATSDRDGSWTLPDPAAQRLVCTQDVGARVCVQQVHAGLLDAVAPLARSELAAVADLAPWTAAQEAVIGGVAPADVLDLPALDDQGRPFRAGLADQGSYRSRILGSQAYSNCPSAGAGPADLPKAAVTADAVAGALLQRSTTGLTSVPGAVALHAQLAGEPVTARNWLRDYLRAAPMCDLPVLQRLAGR